MKLKLKKILILILTISLLIGYFPIAAIASTGEYVKIDNKEGAVGETVTVEIKAAKDLEVDLLQIETNFNSSELEASADNIETVLSGGCGLVGSQVRATEVPMSGTASFSAGTTLVTIQFKILKAGSHTISADVEIENENTSLEDSETVTAVITGKQEATEVSLNKQELTLEVGKSEALVATVLPEEATDKTVTWTSSDETVATVSNGTVTAIKKGTATITAKTSNNKEATCSVTVTQPITGVSLNKQTLELEKGTSEKLIATVEPSNADGDKTVTWTSSDTSVATVEQDGTVNAINKGSAVITARTTNGKEATCNVTVGVPLKSISLDSTNKTLKKGESYTFTVTYNPEDTDAVKTVTWTSSDETVATVDSNGKVTVLKCTGTATITAQSNADNSIKATATVVAAHKDEQLTLHEAKEATCKEKGNKAYYTCSGCDDYYEDATGSVKIQNKADVEIAIDSNAHDWDEGTVTTEPDCTNTGVKTYKCKNDGSHTKTETIPANGHTMQRTDAVAATCEEDGNIEYYYCTVCKKYFKDETGSVEVQLSDTVIKATGHDWNDWVETIPATTTSEGEETRTCKNDESHKQTRAIPKIHAHEFEKTEAKAATCSEEGNIEYWTCTVCGKKYSDSEGNTEVDDVVIPKDTNAHDWNEWNVDKEPTCTEEGSKSRTCKLDANHKETESIEKLPHDLEKVDEVKATCEAEGNIEYYKCKECGKYFEDSTGTIEITDKTSVVTSALGHDWNEGEVTTPETCTENGVKTYTCKNDSSHTKTEVIPAKHKLTKTEAKAATCTKEGNIEYWTCSVCEKIFSDKDGTTEVTNVKTDINPDAHSWNDWVIEKEATVDEEGSKTRTCKNDETHTQTETIEKLPYKIIEGNNQTHVYEKGSDLVITANGTLENLEKLLVDGEELSEDNYSLKSGSTIVSLKTAYLDTLSTGNHTLTFVYNDGRQVSANFKIAKVETANENTTESSTDSTSKTNTTENTTTKSSSPRTGDNIIMWIYIMVISALGVITTFKLFKKRN